MDKKNNTIEYLKSFYIKDYLYMAFAIVIYSIGLTGFIMPNKVVTGGLAGAALLIKYATGIDASTTILVVNLTLGGEDRGDLPDPILYGESADT